MQTELSVAAKSRVEAWRIAVGSHDATLSNSGLLTMLLPSGRIDRSPVVLAAGGADIDLLLAILTEAKRLITEGETID